MSVFEVGGEKNTPTEEGDAEKLKFHNEEEVAEKLERVDGN